MFEPSIIEISKKALSTNLTFIRKIIGDNCLLSSVVKGNAYGHGIEEFVPLAERCGVKHFSVFSADEALRVHKVKGNNVTILIMGGMDQEQIVWAITHDIEFYIFDEQSLSKALWAAQQLNKPAIIHLEVETGMNRTGLDKKELQRVVNIIKNNPANFIIQGLCTHYAGAEDIANHTRIEKQIRNYEEIYNWCVHNQIIPKLRHTASSAATLRYPSARMDMVRIGIMQYGVWSSPEMLITYLNTQTTKIDPLQGVITWKSKIMTVKKVKKGGFVGYGTSFWAATDMTIATIPVGYAHGFSRSLSNQGRVLIKGHRVGVIGRVNMNMIVVDITNLSKCEQGAEVILIGKQDNAAISVSFFGELSGQFNYELLTKLTADIPREIV